MVNRRKKISSFLFPGLAIVQVLLPLLLMLVMFSIRTQQRQLLLKEHTHSELLTTFVLPAGSLVCDAIEDGEFEYNGLLYDVDNVEKKADGYHITALADRAETRLQQVATLGHGKANNDKLHHFPPFIPLFFQQPDSWQCYAGRSFVVFNTHYRPITQQSSPSGHSPPPRMAYFI